ncbi:MAG: GTP pyrophosphokinase family protein [Selenomonas sp.]
MESIYGKQGEALPEILGAFRTRIEEISARVKERTGSAPYEHLICRVKSDESMREKCRRKGLPETPQSALCKVHDAIGVRVVCRFIDDVYLVVRTLKALSGVTVVEEKDYIRDVKPNGYRSYHMIVSIEAPFEDVEGRTPGHFFVELQLRTLAMDSWASLEHEMMYKHTVKNRKLLAAELKRCADELASCDLSMQTIRNLIRESDVMGEVMA